MYRRILLTGGQGFVGRHLCAALSEQMPEAALHLPECDITDAAALGAAVREARPDACIHLAAIAAPAKAQADATLAWNVNLHGTLNLLAALQAASPGCTLLHVSSADAYGRSFHHLGPKLNEDAPLAPLNVYGATKAAADLAAGALPPGMLRVIRVRPFNHVGPGQSADFAVANFARQIAAIEAGTQPPRLCTGTLEARRDFLDVRDVCAAYVRCLLVAPSLPDNVILNIASGRTRSLREVLQDLTAQSPAVIEIATDAALLRRAELPETCGDATRARTLLQWEPAIPWQETVLAVLESWRSPDRADTALPGG